MESESEYIDNRRDSGSIGIGAMIVFIALILVAAVASTIIIKTAEELQQNAENTSSDTREQISGKISLMDIYVSSAGDELAANGNDHVVTLDVYMRVASGSIGVQDGDVSYFISCRLSTDLDLDGTIDTGDENSGTETAVDQVAVESAVLAFSTIDGVDLATGADMSAGVSYKATVTLDSSNTDDTGTSEDEIDSLDIVTGDADGVGAPGCRAMAIAGSTLELRLVVDGGGETLAELSIDSVTLGSSVM